MAAANFDKCLKFTLQFEGGFTNDPKDPGGPTNLGITQATLSALMEYDRLFAAATAKGNEDKKQTAGRKKRTDGAYEDVYRKVLDQKPWKKCPCDVCHDLKHHVILFRGAERNRRRGFHNIWTFYRRLNTELRTAEAA